jgi:hypothetical protein
MINQFWSNEPTVLFNKEYIFEMWPNNSMSYEQKLNAVSRLIIIISILGYILTMSVRILVAGFLMLGIIFMLFTMKKQKLTKAILDEGFTVDGNSETGLFRESTNTTNTNTTTTNPVTLESVFKTEFKEGTKRNPFSNVLLTEIMDDPERNAAPPSFNPDIDVDITKNVKKTVQMLNPGIKNTSKQLYGDLYENFNLDQSNRVFFSTANTRVNSDQTAFGNYLYGNMPSAKESTPEGNLQREKDSYRYTLY